ncbi:MAG: aldo/keto reductase [Pleurocapsa minor GSE-CHR-MK-17-07R]|jgi:aryl-alcohol dehydrogenase-like predicted oxidoreductase|nr:aldo/keto reductase [Pleurocapsa minor GSE-CHR-MK 17-07R]
MNYRRLGRTGLKVSALCLGTMTFGWSADEATSFSIMDAALDAGINFFDTADIYSRWIDGHKGGESETIIGKWFARHDRDRIVLATKVRGQMWDGPNGEGLSRTHILRAVEDSLRRLNTDYIDLYQVHWPDKETPLEETLSALDTLVRQGKVRYIGASNYPAWLLMKSLWAADKHSVTPFVCIQPHYSLMHRAEFERELEAACIDQGIAVIPYSPLAAGFLTGKYTRQNTAPDSTRSEGGLIQRILADPDRSFAILDEVNRIAREHRVPPSHVALAWLLAKPVISAPIVGARTVAQFQDVAGAADLILLPEEIEALNTASAEC